jgi:hypothetical protein
MPTPSYSHFSQAALRTRRNDLRHLLAQAKRAVDLGYPSWEAEVKRLQEEIEVVTNHLQGLHPHYGINVMLRKGYRLVITPYQAYLIKDGVVGKIVVDYADSKGIAYYQRSTKVLGWEIVSYL